MISFKGLKRSLHFDNRKENSDYTPFQGDDEMAKINRTVQINGKKHFIRANTEQEYVDKIEKLLGNQTAFSTPANKHDFGEYAQNWFDVYSKPNIEKATATTYQRQLTRYLKPFFAGKSIEDISPDDVQQLFNSMQGAKTTKDKTKMVLNQILESAIEDGYLSRNPLKSKKVKVKGSASKPTKPYTVEQMQYLVQHIPDVKDATERAFLALLTLHPLRLEEVLGLKRADIDTDNMTLSINRAVTHPTRNQPEVKKTKTEDSVRTLALAGLAVSYLPDGPADEFIFGGKKPLSYTQVRTMCRHIQKDTGFSESITPIRFRTTVLTDIYDQTKDIKLTQEMAGHNDPTTTMKYYTKGRETLETGTSVIEGRYSA